MNPTVKKPFSLDDGNWIPVWRQIRDSWLWRDPEKLRAWLDVLMMANFEEGIFHFKGHPYTMKRGQTACTIRGLSERWRWDRKRVRAFLEQLEGDHAVVISHPVFDAETGGWRDHKSPHGFCLLTVVRYPLRASSDFDGTTNGTTNAPTTAPTNGTTNAPYLRTLEKGKTDPATPGAAEPPSEDATVGEIPEPLKALPRLSRDPQLCKRYWDLTKTWGNAYPSVDIPSELRAADAWLQANPDRPKKRIVAFLNNWMKNAEKRHNDKRTESKVTVQRPRATEVPDFNAPA